jgi:hypothetical protein
VTELEHDVDVLVVLEVMQKLDDVGVLQTLVDAYLAHQLRNLQPTFCLERCLTKEDFCMTLTAKTSLVS